MTTHPAATGEHLEDGLLVRLLDGQADADEGAEARAHLAACGDCGVRLDTLRRRGAALSRVLARTDFPLPQAAAPVPPAASEVIPLRRRAPAPSSARPWLRAAAVVLVALGVGVLASPARAWIARWVSERLATGPGATGERPTPSVAPAPVTPVAGSSVRFTPSGDELALAVAHPQAAGAVTLLAVAGGEVTAEVVAGTGDAELLVLPAGLRIGNDPASAAEFRVGIPASVRRVRLRVGTGTERVVGRTEIGAEMRVALEGGR